MQDGSEYSGLEPDEDESFSISTPPRPDWIWFAFIPVRLIGNVRKLVPIPLIHEQLMELTAEQYLLLVFVLVGSYYLLFDTLSR